MNAAGGREVARLADVGTSRRWWVSWYFAGVFEYHGPWWTTGAEMGGAGRRTICAAVVAPDADAARAVIVESHDDPAAAASAIEWRFAEQCEPDWEPFTDRFRRAGWMQWPPP